MLAFRRASISGATLVLSLQLGCGAKATAPELTKGSGQNNVDVIRSDEKLSPDGVKPTAAGDFKLAVTSDSEIVIRPKVECTQSSLADATASTLVVNCVVIGHAGAIAAPDEGKFEWSFDAGIGKVAPTMTVLDENGSSAQFTFTAPRDSQTDLFKTNQFAILHAADAGDYKVSYKGPRYSFTAMAKGAKLGGQRCQAPLPDLINVRQQDQAWTLIVNSPSASGGAENAIVGSGGRVQTSGGNYILLLGGDLKQMATGSRILAMDTSSVTAVGQQTAIYAGPSAIVRAGTNTVLRFRSEVGLCAPER